MYVLDRIQINKNNRIVVVPDEDSESPETWGWDVEIHEIDGAMVNDTNELTLAATEAQSYYRRGVWTEEQRDRAIHIFKVLSGDDREFKVHNFRGSVQPDVATILEVGNDLGLYHAYKAWRRGEVYGVIHERRKRWVTVDGSEIMETWEECDAVWGNYLDEEYTALDVAREHFDLEN